MTEVLAWEDPPEVKRGQRPSKYQPIIDSVKAKPNTWALVMENVNAASAKVFTQHGLKITTRSMGDKSGRVNVWAMFPSDEGEAPADVEVTSKPKRTPRKKAAATRKRPTRTTKS